MKLKEIIGVLNRISEKATMVSICDDNHGVSITKTAAYRLYGRTNVDRWIIEGLIKISDKKLDRAKLEATAAASNRITYLPVAER